LADLIVHTGSVHRRTVVVLEERPQDPVPRQYPDPSVQGSVLVDWFEEGLRRLCAAFESTPASTKVLSFSQDHTAGFWLVRMAVETTTHRWDAESAGGSAAPIDARLAACGIDEFAVLEIPKLENHESGGPPHALLLESRDFPAAWVLTLLKRGASMLRRETQVEADSVVAGPANDLYLALTGRGELGDLHRSGDPAVTAATAAAIATIPDARR
jgi:uncharacterized protein (TIGR03083 family)